ncbi:MAG: hypothetical protein M3Z33_02355 [Actinomycetota bacterium]|nr:hypothetical protein [Actinomycetota bacterium]
MVELLMKPQAAAAFVGVSPDVLNVWTEVLGIPLGIPIGDGERLYPVTGLVSLRDTLKAEKSIVPLVTGPLARRVHEVPAVPDTPVNVVVVHVGRRGSRKRN